MENINTKKTQKDKHRQIQFSVVLYLFVKIDIKEVILFS